MKRDSFVWGIILIALGVGFLVWQWRPEVFAGWFSWPWIVIGGGAVFAVASLLSRTGGMMIPALFGLGVGGILLYQTRTGDWESWSYLWTLMPGLAGLGILIGGLYDREMRAARPAGFILLLVSLGLFAVFGGFFGLDPDILRFWPVLLILLGVAILFRALRPGSRK